MSRAQSFGVANALPGNPVRGDHLRRNRGCLSASTLLFLLMGSAMPWAGGQSTVGPHEPVLLPAVEEATIEGLQTGYLAGSFDAEGVVKAHLARIEAYDKQGPYLNTVINLNPQALEDARALDRALKETGKLTGALHGVPVVIKDNIDVAGLPMTNGFQGWKGYFPPGDAPLVDRIRKAGGIILAKVSLSEWAMGGGDNINSVLPGFARNPYHTAFATGGSSGGTGAALAASFAVVGIGTDTGGSVRMPAAHGALAGLRPTVGLVSRTGIVPLVTRRDTAGPMARNTRDLAVLLDVIAGPDAADPATANAPAEAIRGFSDALATASLAGTRVGILRQAFPEARTDPEVLRNFERTLAELRQSGVEIVDPLIVPELDSIPRPPQTRASFRSDLEAWMKTHPGVPFASLRALADSRLVHPLHQAAFDEAARSLPADEDPATLEGRKNEDLLKEAFARAMSTAGVDLLVLPTWAQLPAVNGDRNTQMTDAPKPPPDEAPVRLRSSLTFVGSMLQWPAISVPSGFSSQGLPLGLQIVGRAWEDRRVVAFAHAYEKAHPHRRPPATVPALAESFTSKFLGTWHLHAILDRDPITGIETPAGRAADSGLLVYAEDGSLSVQIVRSGRDSLKEPSAEGFSSYFGRWQLDQAAGCVWHSQTRSLNPASDRTRVRRDFRFDDRGRLHLATPPRIRPRDTKESQSVFVWERISATHR